MLQTPMPKSLATGNIISARYYDSQNLKILSVNKYLLLPGSNATPAKKKKKKRGEEVMEGTEKKIRAALSLRVWNSLNKYLGKWF